MGFYTTQGVKRDLLNKPAVCYSAIVSAANSGTSCTLAHDKDDILVGGIIWRVVRPRQESNLRTWLRRPTLYPLSYEGMGLNPGLYEPG